MYSTVYQYVVLLNGGVLLTVVQSVALPKMEDTLEGKRNLLIYIGLDIINLTGQEKESSKKVRQFKRPSKLSHLWVYKNNPTKDNAKVQHFFDIRKH